MEFKLFGENEKFLTKKLWKRNDDNDGTSKYKFLHVFVPNSKRKSFILFFIECQVTTIV